MRNWLIAVTASLGLTAAPAGAADALPSCPATVDTKALTITYRTPVPDGSCPEFYTASIHAARCGADWAPGDPDPRKSEWFIVPPGKTDQQMRVVIKPCGAPGYQG